jgi:dihydrofolate reductase
VQGLGGPDEDLRGGFERGGWARPLFDNEAAAFVNQVYQRADAFLFGRRTYEIFAGYWGVMADSVNPIAAALNTRPKYVESTTLTDPRRLVLRADRPHPLHPAAVPAGFFARAIS